MFQSTENSNPKPCYFEKLLHLTQLDLLLSFFKEYLPNPHRNVINQNFFSYVFINEMSHDWLERLFWIDDDLLGLFSKILTPSFLENTLVIVMGKMILKFLMRVYVFKEFISFKGDHGHKFHPIRLTKTGKSEWLLPVC